MKLHFLCRAVVAEMLIFEIHVVLNELINVTVQNTSNAPTNVGKHVNSNIA